MIILRQFFMFFMEINRLLIVTLAWKLAGFTEGITTIWSIFYLTWLLVGC